MKHSNHSLSDDSLKGISNTFHSMGDGSYYINHNCFLAENHIVVQNQIYLLFDYTGDLISTIIPYKVEDVLIVTDFIMIVELTCLLAKNWGEMNT
jgi:hypothetical protein